MLIVRPRPPRGAHAERDHLAHREIAPDGAREPDDGRAKVPSIPRVATDELRASLQLLLPLRPRLVGFGFG